MGNKKKTKTLDKPAVSIRLTSYQKMKQKYEATIHQLTDDIITLVEEEDFMKVTTVKQKWIMKLNLEKLIWRQEQLSTKLLQRKLNKQP